MGKEEGKKRNGKGKEYKKRKSRKKRNNRKKRKKEREKKERKKERKRKGRKGRRGASVLVMPEEEVVAVMGLVAAVCFVWPPRFTCLGGLP